MLIGLYVQNNSHHIIYSTYDQYPLVYVSPGTPASSTTKTGRHDIAEILLKVALNTKNQINQQLLYIFLPCS
jgi:hypothetical protein